MGTKNSKEINKQTFKSNEEIKLSDDVIEQIKDFNHRRLIEEQELLIDKLILNDELKKWYKKYGLCEECKQPSSDYDWCRLCNAQRFQQNFNNWTSKNHNIDGFIQNAQLKAKNGCEVLEWFEYDKFENVEYLAKGSFGTVHKAMLKNGPITSWDLENNQWKRSWNKTVALKFINNSVEILREIESDCEVYCYGVTKDPKTNNFMTVMDYNAFRNCYIKYDVCKECKQANTGSYWCQPCNAKRFQQNFKNWTSKNHDIDEFIQNSQLNAKNCNEVLEWIEYDRFENVEYLAKDGFETVYKAIWKDIGPITNWNSLKNQWKRSWDDKAITLKCLHNSVEILKEINSYIKVNNEQCVVRYYGITKDPGTNNFMVVMHYKPGFCIECNQLYIDDDNTWDHQSCNAQRFQKNFKNWTSGNHGIDKFIQNAQLKAKNEYEILEWIEYNRFENVEYLVKGDFGTIYKAIWRDGPIRSWDSKCNQWKRSWDDNENKVVALKCLYNSQDIMNETLKEIKSDYKIRCYGITKNLKTNNLTTVMDYYTFKKCYIMYGACEKCKQPYIDYNTWNHQSCNAQRFQQNFENWTSKNYDIDKFIQNAQLKGENEHEILEWIEYNRFENVEYLAKGGFGTVYKAIWKDGPIESWDSENNQWKRSCDKLVALKCLHNSQDITFEFLKEVELHFIINNKWVVTCYGITRDPTTKNFMMVMEYANNGSLRQHLNDNFNSLNWIRKLRTLHRIADSLKNIHDNNLIHQDFHCGNILNILYDRVVVADLGLCQSVNVKPSQSGDKKIYGVLPFVAPEVLRGKEYTQASDVYAFGMVAYEVCTGLPPYHDMAHEEYLAMRICQGLRPQSNYKIPQPILDLINQCWDADPLKRPKAGELVELLSELSNNSYTLIYKQADENNKQAPSLLFTSIFSYTTHPQAVYTSRLLDYKNLPEPKNTDDIENSFVTEYSESTRVDFTELNINFNDEFK